MIGCDYDRYVTVEAPTDVNTKGSITQTWATSFTSYCKIEPAGGTTDGESGKRTTTSKFKCFFPYNASLLKYFRFYDNNVTSEYYYVVNVQQSIYQVEMEIMAELKDNRSL